MSVYVPSYHGIKLFGTLDVEFTNTSRECDPPMIKQTPVAYWDLAVQRVEASFRDDTIIYILQGVPVYDS